jgi:tetratricopeptide (TPR) repeat protein
VARVFARERGKEEPERARALVERALTQNPADSTLIGWLVSADLSTGKKQEGLKRIREAVAAHPERPAFHVMLGRTLFAVGEQQEAIQVLEDALQRWPSAVGITQQLVALLSRAGRMQRVQEVLEAADAEQKLTPGSQVLLAQLKIRSGDDEAAIKLLEAALADAPGLVSASNDLAYLLAQQGKELERATELAQEARAQAPESAQIADTLGWVYFRRGITDAALAQFEEAVDLAEEQSPAWATASYHRALALRELGRRDEAVASVERALASGVDFPEAEDARRAMKELAGSGTG